MKNLPTKTKLILFAAFAIAALLLVCNIALLISNNVVQRRLNRQEKQLEQLKDTVASNAEVGLNYKFKNVEISL